MQKKPIYSPDRAKVTRQPKARKIGVNMSSDAKKRPLSKEGWWHATSTMLPCHYKDPKLGTIVVHLCTILGTSLLRDHFSWAAPGNSLQSTIVKLLLPRSGLFCAGPRLPVDPEAPMGGHGGWLRPMGVWRWRRRRKRPVPASNTKQCPAGSMAPRNAGKILHIYSSFLGLDDIQQKTKSRAKMYKFFQLTSP